MTNDQNDVFIEYNTEKKFFDIELSDNGKDLKAAVNLRNAVGICLFCERRTDSDDLFPNMAGYAGDALNDLGETNLGNKIWQYLRGKTIDRFLPQIEQDCEEALQWLIDDFIASSVNVTATYDGETKQRLRFEVEIVRLTGENLQYAYVWQQPLFAN